MTRLTICAGFGLFLVASTCAKEITAYRLGEVIEEDVVTPASLVVVDPDATEALQLKQAQRFPVIVRFDPTIVDTVENDLREVFAHYRSNFLNAVEASFNRRQLDEAATALPQFQRVVASFKKQHAAFPLSTNRSESWCAAIRKASCPPRSSRACVN